MRLFIAVNFREQTKIKLLALCNELRSRSERGNFSEPENLHLTLVFLGECDAKQATTAKRALNAVRFEPFTITIEGGGYFDKGRPNLVFCELRNDSGRNKLRQLQFELSTILSMKGFKLDQRRFWPHITLGREVIWKNIDDFVCFIDISFPILEERVTSIELMNSERINGKQVYAEIHKKGLDK